MAQRFAPEAAYIGCKSGHDGTCIAKVLGSLLDAALPLADPDPNLDRICARISEDAPLR
jgi:hypothetical protein